MVNSQSDAALISKQENKILRNLGAHQRKALQENHFVNDALSIKDLRNFLTDELKSITVFRERYKRTKRRFQLLS